MKPSCAREELHRLACEAGQAGSWYVRLDTQQCTLSPMAAALFGLPAREITLPAEIWRKRIDSDHMRGLEGAARSAAKDGGHFEFEFKVNRAEGDEYWLYLRGSLLRDAAGRRCAFRRDRRHHRKMRDQQELKRLNETLEQRVAERGEELVRAQEALRQSQKLEAMGQLTGGIAHDFNNLLTPIIANLDLLQKRTDNLRDRRLIDLALKSADSAQILVQRLLAFARRQALQPARVEVAALVEGLADMIARTLGPRIRIALQLSPDLEPVLADPNQLEMAILNLSVNARDAMPLGGALAIRPRTTSSKASRTGCRRALTCGCRSSTPASAWTNRPARARSSRSSPPRASARAQASAFRWSMASPRRWAALPALQRPRPGHDRDLVAAGLDRPPRGGAAAHAETARTGTTGIALVVDDHDLVA